MPEPTPTPEPTPAPTPEPTPAPEPTPTPEPEPSTPPAGKVLVDETEINRLKRIASEKDAADKKRKREEDEAAGKHAEVVKDLEEELATAKAEREKIERNQTVTTVAGRLNFNDPADALLHLPPDTPNDEASIETALKKVAEEKKYLIGGQGTRTGAPGGGNEPTTSPDIDEQIRKAEADGDIGLSTRLKRQKAFSK
jgi:hypothetical protein